MHQSAKVFCEAFEAAAASRRYLFGCNEVAAVVASCIDVAGIIDDFHTSDSYASLPVVRSADVDRDCLVVACLLGKPQTGKRVLDQAGLQNLDFFAFHRYSSLDIPFVRFWGDYAAELRDHADFYQRLEDRLADEESVATYRSLQRFRQTANLEHLRGFVERQKFQYFEPFLAYHDSEEVFVDVGSYDGFTAREFAQRCPGYQAIHVFEPGPKNMMSVRANLETHRDVTFHAVGLSNYSGTALFSSSGSTSAISSEGEESVVIGRLDDIVKEPVTFVKIDIEGEELGALEGARQTIARQRPKLAVCVYHRTEDMRVLTEYVLSVRDDYDIYLRHYTEGVVETVMFFVPRVTA